jgi:hypothetical protein
MRITIICFIIGMFTFTLCDGQVLKPIDSADVFYVFAKNYCGTVEKILGSCGSKNLSIEKIVMVDNKVLEPNLSNVIVFKFSVNGEADLERIKNKLSSVEGIINICTVKNK